MKKSTFSFFKKRPERMDVHEPNDLTEALRPVQPAESTACQQPVMVCLCGGIAVIANLAVQHVPLAALYAAGTEAQNLAVLSLITLVLCIAGAGVTTAALAQKKKKGA